MTGIAAQLDSGAANFFLRYKDYCPRMIANTITIQGTEYNFGEKTYTVNKNMSFKVKLIRYTKNESVVCLCLLKSLVININNKVINFNPRKRVGTYGAKEFNKNLKLQHYLLYKENIDLINNI